MKSLRWSAAMAVLTLSGAAVFAQAPAPGPGAPPAGAPRAAPRGLPPAAKLGDGPWDFKTEKQNLHVEVAVRGIDHPWGLAFLPNGDMLITERDGKLRVVRKGALDPNPVTGLLPILPGGLGGLHP